MKRKLSQRDSKPPKRFHSADIYIEGHGEIDPWQPTFVVPDSVDIVIYQGVGNGLDDAHGEAIVTGKGVPSTLPTLWDPLNHEYDTDPRGTQDPSIGGHRRIYRAGEDCPNYKLFPYNHPEMADLSDSVAKTSYKLSYRPKQPNYFEALSYIADLGTHQGCTLHWACCTVIR